LKHCVQRLTSERRMKALYRCHELGSVASVRRVINAAPD
jgi:hypothetical protein